MLYTCYKIFILFLYSFTVMSVVAPSRINAASFQLSWVDNSHDEDGFYVERKLGTNGTFSLIATVGPSVTAYHDDNLASGTTYCYRVSAFNSTETSGYTNEACGTTFFATATSPAPDSSTVTATLLGQTGEDITGTASQTPDGIKDVRIRLSGVRGTIIGVKITDDGNGVWETPYNGRNWIVAVRPQADPSIVDLYFDFWQPTSSYTLNLTFANESIQTSALVTLTDTLTAATFKTTADQHIAKIGVFRPDTREWFLDRNGNGQWDGCAVDTCVGLFGQVGDVPVTRKINGLSWAIIGTFQPHGLWKFDLNGNNALDNCLIDVCENFGILGDLPVVGDWNGSGTEDIGVFRPSTGEWFLDMNGNGQWDGCGVDKCIGQFGGNGDLPVVGDWNDTGEVRIGIFRPSTGEWFLDMNGSGSFDGCTVDACVGPFGQPGDLPVVGNW